MSMPVKPDTQDVSQLAIPALILGAFCAGSINIGEFIFFRFVSGAGLDSPSIQALSLRA